MEGFRLRGLAGWLAGWLAVDIDRYFYPPLSSSFIDWLDDKSAFLSILVLAILG